MNAKWIGVPSAPLWGLIAMILRFVPYVGTPISAVFPLILAAAVGSGIDKIRNTEPAAYAQYLDWINGNGGLEFAASFEAWSSYHAG